ncbi:MAG: hypothetical protein ACRC62_13080 [Microcoleus sp.]
MSSQLTIAGLDEYEVQLKDLKNRGQHLLLELGQVLRSARSKFANYPHQYWVDWLATNDLKLTQAERAIAAYDCFGLTCDGIPVSLLPVIARAGEEERSVIQSKVRSGASLTAADVRSILKDFRTICPGKRVYLGDSTLAPGQRGVVESIDGETLVVVLPSGDRVPCFVKEVSVKPIEQMSLALSVAKPTGRSSDRSQLLGEEIAFLKRTLFIIFDSDPSWRGDLLLKHPNIEEWGIYL